jgi:hypothetical protein
MRSAFALAWLVSISTTILAQDSAKPAEKWRPKDGLYDAPGANLNDRCMDHTEFVVELADKSISGNEWGCKITNLTDQAPGAIRLDMTCSDYNLAEFIKDPNPEERKFKEIILLRKIDEKSMFVRKTVNGKFKDPDWRAAFCPEDGQRRYTEAKARDKAEAEQKAAEERARPKP